MPRHLDSIDKIVTKYFACVCDEPFMYKDVTYLPRPLKISPLIFRGFTCPVGCAACCPRFSLDYLPKEDKPTGLILLPRKVEFNGRNVTVHSNMQYDNKDYHCMNVDKRDGRCVVHGRQPFSCDFELIRFMEFADQAKPNMLTQKLFGRKHAMMRIDGERGTLCEMLPSDYHTVNEVVRKLERLKAWCAHFKLKHKVNPIIEHVRRWPDTTSMTVRGEYKPRRIKV